MTLNEPSQEQSFAIRHQLWKLCVSNHSPTEFQLFHENELCYQGKLELINNGDLLDVSQAEWKFRHRSERIEQWCQWNHTDNLSLNMNYYFHQQAVVIEYLARNSIPTRLDIRHVIEPLHVTQPLITPQPLSTQPDWQRSRHGLPSNFIQQSAKADIFREAFSATQWIVLGKV